MKLPFFKIWCFTHTDSTYKLEVGVENDKCIVKYLSITANASWGPWDTAPEGPHEALAVMLKPWADTSVSPRPPFSAIRGIRGTRDRGYLGSRLYYFKIN